MDIVVLELHEEIFVELNVGDDAIHGAVGRPCGLIAVGIVFGVELQPVSAWHTDHGIPSVGLACAGEGGGGWYSCVGGTTIYHAVKDLQTQWVRLTQSPRVLP